MDAMKNWQRVTKLVEIDGLGHFWGVKANVNDTIWQFFADHPLE